MTSTTKQPEIAMIRCRDSFEFRAKNGTHFVASYADLLGGVFVEIPAELCILKVAADFAEMGAYHSAQVRPRLDGDIDYAAIEWHFRRV